MDTQPIGAARLLASRYGKSRVRLVQVTRDDDLDNVRELSVQVLCEGDFESSYTQGDNSNVVATDTMKNTVYALAKREGVAAIEKFGQTLAAHFLGKYGQIARVRVKIAEEAWERMEVAGEPHGSSFIRPGAGQRTSCVTATREGQSIESGISGVTILKSSHSAFEGFPRDEFTTLAETKDRILATSMRARWRYASAAVPFDASWRAVRQTLLESFARHHSRSVQHTLYAMAESVIAAHAELDEIRIAMPNKHHLLVDLGRFGMSNDDEIFVPTDEPHGYIEARFGRCPGYPA